MRNGFERANIETSTLRGCPSKSNRRQFPALDLHRSYSGQTRHGSVVMKSVYSLIAMLGLCAKRLREHSLALAQTRVVFAVHSAHAKHGKTRDLPQEPGIGFAPDAIESSNRNAASFEQSFRRSEIGIRISSLRTLASCSRGRRNK